MPLLKLWIHLVWATKYREPVMNKKIMFQIFNHIRENARNKGIYLYFVNGYSDHIHCLISLGTGQNIDNIVQLIKGESSHWINEQKLTDSKFRWQTGYFAASVCESHVKRVREYIKNQESHHRKKPFLDELETLLKECGLEMKKDFLD